jgi:hypothetical protein
MTEERDKDREAGGRLDLSPLLPPDDTARFEALVLRIRRLADPELALRREEPTLWSVLGRWRRPVLAASGLLAAASIFAFAVLDPRSGSVESGATTTDIWGVPSEWSRWMQSGERPTPGFLIGWERDQ